MFKYYFTCASCHNIRATVGTSKVAKAGKVFWGAITCKIGVTTNFYNISYTVVTFLLIVIYRAFALIPSKAATRYITIRKYVA
jgi:hypothetical protein